MWWQQVDFLIFALIMNCPEFERTMALSQPNFELKIITWDNNHATNRYVRERAMVAYTKPQQWKKGDNISGLHTLVSVRELRFYDLQVSGVYRKSQAQINGEISNRFKIQG